MDDINTGETTERTPAEDVTHACIKIAQLPAMDRDRGDDLDGSVAVSDGNLGSRKRTANGSKRLLLKKKR